MNVQHQKKSELWLFQIKGLLKHRQQNADRQTALCFLPAETQPSQAWLSNDTSQSIAIFHGWGMKQYTTRDGSPSCTCWSPLILKLGSTLISTAAEAICPLCSFFRLGYGWWLFLVRAAKEVSPFLYLKAFWDGNILFAGIHHFW